MSTPFTPDMFDRVDDSNDALFYVSPRKVVHIDDGTIAAAMQAIAEILPPHSVLLDLMSSWRSHFPADFAKHQLIGLGLGLLPFDRHFKTNFDLQSRIRRKAGEHLGVEVHPFLRWHGAAPADDLLAGRRREWQWLILSRDANLGLRLVPGCLD